MRGWSKKVTLPLAVLATGMLAGAGLIAVRPSVQTRLPEPLPPLVRAIEAKPTRMQLHVDAQGTVAPRTESELVAEVSGRINWVSASLASGGFIEAGDVLVRIDPRDYEVAVRRAEAALERTRSELELARSAYQRRSSLSEHGVTSHAALDDARNAARVAEAMAEDAAAGLDQARRELERTEIVAPFAGRVRQKNVDVGQFVGRGASLARVYAVDYAEVRLAITDRDAAFVRLPIAYRGGVDEIEAPVVRMTTRFAGEQYHWEGRIVRTEGEIDTRTRMIHAVARVDDPYARGSDPNRPPLAVGLFVEARIQGVEVEGVVTLPRSALRGSNEVVTVDERGQLQRRQVEVLQRSDDRVFVAGGLAAGHWIVTSPLPVRIEGMQVSVERDGVENAPKQSRAADPAE